MSDGLGAGWHSSCEPESAALHIAVESAMQDQVAIAGARLQWAGLELTQPQADFVHARLTALQVESNRLLELRRAAEARRQHADRMMAAMELRLEAADEQAEELLKALEALAGAVDRRASLPELIGPAFANARRLIAKYGPSISQDGE